MTELHTMQESLPRVTNTIAFEFAGKFFDVQRRDYQHTANKRHYTTFTIVDEDGVQHGKIEGFMGKIIQGEKFQASISDNTLYKQPQQVRHLVRTAIGEIIAQGPPGFIWHSDTLLSDQGVKMYEGLGKELNDPQSRFFGKLKMRWTGRDGVYEIRKINPFLENVPRFYS